jgi:hypothetical protein
VQIPTVTGVTVTPSTAEVAKGGSTTFSASVAASGGAGTGVTWSVVTTSVSANTKFSTSTPGLFQVASDETKTSITIKATSTFDTGKSGTATVSVPQPTVTSVSISPSGSVIVAPGGTQQFSATVKGTNSPSQTVTWSIVGTHNTGTTITTGGNLTVAAGETAETFTVKATSTADTGKCGEVTVYAYDPHSIKTKFGITTTGTAGVTATFNALHVFIQGGGLSSYPDTIKLGDYIDLEGGLTVTAYNSTGGFSISAAEAVQVITANGSYNPNYTGVLLRLIVVGINSFHSGKGVNGAYTVTDNDSTPHIVFQFQNVPVKRRLNRTSINTGGYAASEMRKYLVPTGDEGSGKFLEGLISAGVPAEVLWAPKRYTAAGNSGFAETSDPLWLPTMAEMEGTISSWYPSGFGEMAANQAQLEYYDSNARRVKYHKDLAGYPNISTSEAQGQDYWSATLYPLNDVGCFCYLNGEGTFRNYDNANNSYGAAPAFCVK